MRYALANARDGFELLQVTLNQTRPALRPRPP
jgi:hypothetical protein